MPPVKLQPVAEDSIDVWKKADGLTLALGGGWKHEL